MIHRLSPAGVRPSLDLTQVPGLQPRQPTSVFLELYSRDCFPCQIILGALTVIHPARMLPTCFSRCYNGTFHLCVIIRPNIRSLRTTRVYKALPRLGGVPRVLSKEEDGRGGGHGHGMMDAESRCVTPCALVRSLHHLKAFLETRPLPSVLSNTRPPDSSLCHFSCDFSRILYPQNHAT